MEKWMAVITIEEKDGMPMSAAEFTSLAEQANLAHSQAVQSSPTQICLAVYKALLYCMGNGRNDVVSMEDDKYSIKSYAKFLPVIVSGIKLKF